MRTSIKQILVGAAAAATIAAGAVAPAASAAPAENVRTIKSVSSGHYIEVGGWSTVTGAWLNQWSLNTPIGAYDFAGANQQWELSEGTGNIRNRHSGKCITTSDYRGRAVYQAPCSSNWDQQWLRTSFTSWSDDGPNGYTVIKNPATGYVLDVYYDSRTRGATIISWPPNGGDNQRWRFEFP